MQLFVPLFLGISRAIVCNGVKTLLLHFHCEIITFMLIGLDFLVLKLLKLQHYLSVLYLIAAGCKFYDWNIEPLTVGCLNMLKSIFGRYDHSAVSAVFFFGQRFFASA